MNKLTKIILTFLLLVTVAMGYSTVAMAAEANSMIYYFNSTDGRPVTSHEISGEALVKQGLAIKKVDVPTDVESWRLSLDLNTNAVVVFAEGKDEEGALAQKKTEDEAEALAGKEKSKADEKAEADRQAANEAEFARNATRQAAEAERKTAYANSEAGREEQSVRDAESARNATREAAEAERKNAAAEANTAEANSESNAAETEAASIAEEK